MNFTCLVYSSIKKWNSSKGLAYSFLPPFHSESKLLHYSIYILNYCSQRMWLDEDWAINSTKNLVIQLLFGSLIISNSMLSMRKNILASNPFDCFILERHRFRSPTYIFTTKVKILSCQWKEMKTLRLISHNILNVYQVMFHNPEMPLFFSPLMKKSLGKLNQLHDVNLHP